MSSLYTDHKCIKCLLDKYSNTKAINIDDEQKTLYVKELLKIISEAPITMSAPEIVEEITFLQNKYGIDAFDYSAIKAKYNRLLMSFEEEVAEEIKKSENSLYLAMCYAFTGNYIDFGALSDINEEKLRSLIDETKNVVLDMTEFSRFEKELEQSKRLVYLTDNCGEIVFDKLLISLLKEKYPEMTINAIVRGRDVLNDATIEDAHQVGLDKIVSVTSNGTGIAGTVLERINTESLELINNADVIISKGMGNFETLKGTGLNIYYMFMCKCDKFCKMFNAPRYSYMFLNEKRVNVN